MSNNNFDDFINNIKSSIEKQIDVEYTEYKILCLENLEYILENKRNEVVKSILDGIDVNMCTDAENVYEPIIQVKLVNRREK